VTPSARRRQRRAQTGPTPLPLDARLLAALFAASGALHLVRPDVYETIMPRALPAHRALVYLSGIAELLAAGGMLHPRTRAAAGVASAVLLLAVYPANIQMALDARSTRRKVVAWGRLPLQLPMLRTACRVAKPGCDGGRRSVA
jgi:uncharacterized membrane protein